MINRNDLFDGVILFVLTGFGVVIFALALLLIRVAISP